MKKLLLLSLIFLLALSAHASERAEAPRRKLLPQHSAKGDTPSRYVESLTVWQSANDTLRSTFAMPVWWINRQILIRIGGAECAYDLMVNGRHAGYASSGATASEFNITRYTQEGRNEVAIVPARTERDNALYQNDVRGLHDVAVICQPTIRVRDIATTTRLNDNGDGVAEVSIAVKCDALNPKSCRLHYALRLNDSILLTEGYREMSLNMRREDTVRFACVVPKSALWSRREPHLLRLDIENKIDNRLAERVSCDVGLRHTALKENILRINGEPVTLHLAEAKALKNLDELERFGYNGIIIDCDNRTDSLLTECDRRGIYAVVCAPIDTRSLGNDIRRNGNPTNNPNYTDSFLRRNYQSLHTTKHHPSVIGYMIGRGTTRGIAIYESYLRMKSLAPDLPILYPGAENEWCTDHVNIK